MSTRSREMSDAAVKASYIIANKVAVASKPRVEEELGEKRLSEVAEIVRRQTCQSTAWQQIHLHSGSEAVSQL